LLRSQAWEPIVGATPITLMQTNEHTCKWPIGDAPILFCGLHSDARSPYCEQHRQLATARATA
jgi:GcrA cell cycle regulator